MAGIKIINKEDKEKWDNFIKNNLENEERFYRLFSWRDFLIKTFNYKPYYLAFILKEKILAVLPLMLVKSFIFGNMLISLPISNNKAGGPIFGKVGNKKKKEIFKKINLEVIKISKKEKVKAVQLKGILLKNKEIIEGEKYECPLKDYSFQLNLKSTEEEIWKNLNKKTRNIIRKAIKENVKIEKVESQRGINEFYEVHLKTMKELGSPPQSKKFSLNLIKMFPDNFHIFNAKLDGKVIGSISIIIYNNFGMWSDGVYLQEYKSLNPISLLLWESVKFCKKNNLESLDLGTSRQDSSNFRFKKKWTDRFEENLKYYYFFNKKEIRDPRDEGYSKKSEIWRKYVPLFVTRIIGPYLRKSFG